MWEKRARVGLERQNKCTWGKYWDTGVCSGDGWVNKRPNYVGRNKLKTELMEADSP